MSLDPVFQSDFPEYFEGLEVFLAMTTALLLASTLVSKVLADLNPPLSILMEKLNELHSLFKRPEVWLVTLMSWSLTLLLLLMLRLRFLDPISRSIFLHDLLRQHFHQELYNIFSDG